MPFKGLDTLSSSLYKFSFILVAVIGLAVFYSLSNPKSALADHIQYEEDSGGQCHMTQRRDDGSLAGSILLPATVCQGDQGVGACQALVKPHHCSTATVPGSGSSQTCGHDLKATYTKDSNGNVTGYHFDTVNSAACSSENWSQGVGDATGAVGLNIDFFDPTHRPIDKGWVDLNEGGSGGGDFKIANGTHSFNVSISDTRLSPYLRDPNNFDDFKRFVFYPNCGGREDSMSAGCFRASTLGPANVPIIPPPPPCVMPTELITNNLNCTPAIFPATGVQRNTDVIHAGNLNQAGFCQIDSVNISESCNPDATGKCVFPYPNYWNTAVNGASVVTAPANFSKTDTKVPLTLTPGKTYWVSYWDKDSAQLSKGKSFTTLPLCTTPNAPAFTQIPQCSFNFPFDTEPQKDLVALKWNPPSSPGQGLYDYQIELSTNPASPSGHIDTYASAASGTRLINFGAPAYGLARGVTYYYRIRASNWGGYGAWSVWSAGTLLRTKPSAPSVSGTGYPQLGTNAGFVNLAWTDNSSVPGPSTGWNIDRTAAGTPNKNFNNGANTKTLGDTPLPVCNNTSYTYQVNGFNICGSGAIGSKAVVCPANKPPTCGAVQYQESSGTPWINYPAAGLIKNPGSTINVRRVCSDPENNPLVYSWTTTCGTVNPSTGTEVFGNPTGHEVTKYTFPTGSSAYNLSCNITFKMRDSLGAITLPDSVAIAKTFPQPSVGIQSLSVGSRSISRTNNNTNLYDVITNVTQNQATMTYTISGYYNPTTQGGNINRPATLTINTSSAPGLANGMINICNLTWGTCKFDNGTTTFGNITAPASSYNITITFTPAQLAFVKEVLLDPSNVAGKYGIEVDFNTTGLNNAPVSTFRTGSPTIKNKVPFCSGVTFTPPSPFKPGDIDIRVDAADDWGLKSVAMSYKTVAQSTYTAMPNGTATFAGNPRSGNATITWDASALASNYYNVLVSITDTDGKSTSCLATDNIVGDEVPPGPPGPPVILIDNKAPQCTGTLTVSPNSNGTRLGFSATGTDPAVSGSFSGLTRVEIFYRKPSATTPNPNPFQTTGLFQVISPSVQTYPYSISNAAANAFNMDNQPAGLYTFRTVWTDRALNTNTILCDTAYSKGSRISGQIYLNTGIDGTSRQSYVNEAGISPASPFKVGTKLPSAGYAAATWFQTTHATPTGCTTTASYPGDGNTTGCDSRFISSTEFPTGTLPIVEVQFPKLSLSDIALGKYRCSMKVFDTTLATWRLIRTDNLPAISCTGSTCVCDFQLRAGDITANSTNIYNTTSRWPTHVEIDLAYNSDQISGTVRDKDGVAIGGGNVKVTVGGVTSAAANVSSTSGLVGTYAAPAGTNSVTYPRTSNPSTVAYTPGTADPTKLCIWAFKNDINTNSARNTASSFNTPTKVGTLARTLSLSTWTVGASAQCVAPASLASNKMSPEYQNQLNFVQVPKVHIQGKVYLLNSDGLCTSPNLWAANQITGANVPVRITMTSSVNAPADNTFYSPDSVTNNTYTTDGTYNYYANSLPANMTTWQIQRTVAPTDTKYVVCNNNTIAVTNAITGISTYPAASILDVPVGVYLAETNDWWQTYNGGVHALNSITDHIPTVNLTEEVSGFNMHTIVGNSNNAIYASPLHPGLITGTFRGATTGALVTTRANLTTLSAIAGRANANWRITGGDPWKETNMKPLRIPFADATDPHSVAAIKKIEDLGTGWGSNVSGIKDSNDAKVLIGSDTSIGSSAADFKYGTNNYLLVKGKLDINGNLKPSGTALNQTVFIIATGDVKIAANVSEINAFIYTPGNISIETAGADSVGEVPLKVYGGLYAGGNVTTKRDLTNSLANFGYPSVQVMFNPALIISSRGSVFPSQLKETNVYWSQD